MMRKKRFNNFKKIIMKILFLSFCLGLFCFSFAHNRPKLKVENNLIYKSILDYHQSKNSDKFQQVVKHLDPLLNYLSANHPNLKTELNESFNSDESKKFNVALTNIVKVDVLDVLNLIADAEIKCNESYDLNIAYNSYQVISSFVVSQHGSELDKKIRNKFDSILKIHTNDHGGKKHRHCTRNKAEAISELIDSINRI